MCEVMDTTSGFNNVFSLLGTVVAIGTSLATAIVALSSIRSNARLRTISEWARQQQGDGARSQDDALENLRRRAEGQLLANTIVSGRMYFAFLYPFALQAVVILNRYLALGGNPAAASDWITEYGQALIAINSVFFWICFTLAVSTSIARKRVRIDYGKRLSIKKPRLEVFTCWAIAKALVPTVACTTITIWLWQSMPAFFDNDKEPPFPALVFLAIGSAAFAASALAVFKDRRIYPEGTV